MVPAAELKGYFFRAGGDPVINEPVELMMVHPEEGPWWPARTITNSEGRGRFDSIPPGAFEVHFRGPQGHTAELTTLQLPPGASHELGAVVLE